MHVGTVAKGFDHVSVAAEMGHKAQLNLRIVGAEESAALLGNEGFSDFASVFAPDGYVLQVGVRRREAPCGRDSLVERGVYAARVRIDELWQCLKIGADEFFQGAVGQYFFYDGMFSLEAFEHGFRCLILSALGLLGLVAQVHFAEEYFAYLAWRGEQKLVAGQVVDFAFQALHALVEELVGFGQGGGVESHAVHLHACQDGHERHLNFVEHASHSIFFHFGLERFHEPQCHVGILGRIVAHQGGGYLAHR